MFETLSYARPSWLGQSQRGLWGDWSEQASEQFDRRSAGIPILPHSERDLMRGCFSLPVLTGSRRSVEHRTRSIPEPSDFRWSLSFRCDYFSQTASSFDLEPVFRFSGRLAFSVTAKGQDPLPFPTWTH